MYEYAMAMIAADLVGLGWFIYFCFVAATATGG